MRNLACILVFFAAFCSLPAATVTGTNRNANGVAAASQVITFTPRSTPLVNDAGELVNSSPIRTNLSTNGTFSVWLETGYYDAATTWTRDLVRISVPNDSSTNDWLSLRTNVLTLSSNAPRILTGVAQGTNIITTTNSTGVVTVHGTGGGGSTDLTDLNNATNALNTRVTSLESGSGGVTTAVATNIARDFATNSALVTSNALWLAPYALSFPTGLVVYTHPRSGFFSDSSGTASATNQALIARWNDASGRGNHLTSTNTTARPRMIYEAGNPLAFFANGESQQASNVLEFPPALLINSRAFSVFFVLQPMATLTNLGILQASNNNPGIIIEGNGDERGVVSLYGTSLVQSHIPARASWSVLGVVGDTNMARIYHHGESTNLTAYASATASGGIIGRWVNQRPYYGKIASVLLFDRALPAQEAESVVAKLQNAFNLATPNRNRLIVIGDSIVRGDTTSNGLSYAQQVAKRLGPEWEIINLGLGGQYLSTIKNHSTNTIVPLILPGRRNVMLIEAGSNDIKLGGASGEDTYTNLVSLAGTLTRAGAQVVVTDILPRQNDSTFNTKRLAFNTLVTNNWSTFASGYAPFAADSTIGDSGDEANTTYYSDTIHPTEQGAGIMANYTAPVILSLPISYQPASAALTNLASNPNVATNILGAGTVTVSSNSAGVWTITGSAGSGDAGGTNARQFGSLTLSNLSSNPRTDYTNRFIPGSNITLTTNSAGEVTIDAAGGGGGSGLTTNGNQFLGVPLAIKSGAGLTNIILRGETTTVSNTITGAIRMNDAATITDEIGSTNWNFLAAPNINTVVRMFDLTNALADFDSVLNSDYFPFFQPASINLTNWSNIPTGAMANVVSTTYLTNWANSISNLAASKQTGSFLLSNLLAMGISNIVAGTNMHIQTNSGTLVLNSTASGGAGGGSGLMTNENQFAANDTLNIKDGAVVTNLVNYTPAPTWDYSNANMAVWFKVDRDVTGLSDGDTVTNVPALLGGIFTNYASTVKYRTSVFPSGASALRFSGASTAFLTASNGAMNANFDRAFTAFVVARMTNGESAGKNLLAAGANKFYIATYNQTALECKMNGLTTASKTYGYPLSPGTAYIQSSTALASWSYIITMVRWDGTNRWVGDGNNWDTEACSGTIGFTGTPLTIGANDGGGTAALRGDIAEVLIYSNALGANFIKRTWRQLANNYGINTNYADYYFCDGDSFTGSGNGLNVTNVWPYLLQNMLPSSNVVFYNSGVNADTVSNIWWGQQQGTPAIFKPPGVNANYLLMAGRNDLGSGTKTNNGTYVHNVTATLLSNLTFNGWNCYFATIPPISSGTSAAGANNERLIANDLYRSDWSDYASGLVDMSRYTNYDTWPSNTVVWQNDAVHPKASGMELIAKEFYNVLTRTKSGGGSPDKRLHQKVLIGNNAWAFNSGTEVMEQMYDVAQGHFAIRTGTNNQSQGTQRPLAFSAASTNAAIIIGTDGAVTNRTRFYMPTNSAPFTYSTPGAEFAGGALALNKWGTNLAQRSINYVKVTGTASATDAVDVRVVVDWNSDGTWDLEVPWGLPPNAAATTNTLTVHLDTSARWAITNLTTGTASATLIGVTRQAQ